MKATDRIKNTLSYKLGSCVIKFVKQPLLGGGGLSQFTNKKF
ncbi:hypothetical protein [Campylobacter cuniculorum]|nr:hypothetical protein [Campylobacter cuniculorum]